MGLKGPERRITVVPSKQPVTPPRRETPTPARREPTPARRRREKVPA